MFKLDDQQKYVEELAKSQGIEAKLVYHEKATDTCYEKAALIGFQPDCVVKALYFGKPGHTIGIVTPELGTKVDPMKILPEVLGYSRKEASQYHLRTSMPYGMEKGTCTPFPYESGMVGDDMDIDLMIVVDHPSIDDKLVDISVGGYGEDAHKVSMHLPYKGIYSILKEKFGEKIVKYGKAEVVDDVKAA